eukprot:TRINITY_DN11384_c0_g1_i1.p1 TRINITY_DN11384_c0_g1~~TRINITY_DN11384_c0_g1_i1.p1  ORF type:complete len:87 (+),score=14.18 TRINITY_DN11384_c0_g1_i1:208-468(+)
MRPITLLPIITFFDCSFNFSRSSVVGEVSAPNSASRSKTFERPSKVHTVRESHKSLNDRVTILPFLMDSESTSSGRSSETAKAHRG